ncbi:hypothetical protein DFJ73DRAFT_850015 [Zopfochytrium polystomum]|nr:hypothetical protein DFJ73DRAFT_850015 [Zopfochytrium polystomum]
MRKSVTVAREALPYAGGVAVASAAAAVAFHVASVSVPQWMKQEERRRKRTKNTQRLLPVTADELAEMTPAEQHTALAAVATAAVSAKSASLPAPAEMNVEDLVAEVTALRAEVERFRAEAAAAAMASQTPDILKASSSPEPAQDATLAAFDPSEPIILSPTLQSIHIASLEAANAQLRETVKRLNAELDERTARENALRREIEQLSSQAASSEEKVVGLRTVVSRLMDDRDTQEKRIEILENNIDQLRTLFTSMVTANSSHRSSPVPPLSPGLGSGLEPITPYLDLSNSSLTEGRGVAESLRGSRILDLSASASSLPSSLAASLSASLLMADAGASAVTPAVSSSAEAETLDDGANALFPVSLGGDEGKVDLEMQSVGGGDALSVAHTEGHDDWDHVEDASAVLETPGAATASETA